MLLMFQWDLLVRYLRGCLRCPVNIYLVCCRAFLCCTLLLTAAFAMLRAGPAGSPVQGSILQPVRARI